MLQTVFPVQTVQLPTLTSQSESSLAADLKLITRQRQRRERESNPAAAEWKNIKKRQQRAAQYGPVVRIRPNLTIQWRRKKAAEKMILLF